MTYIYYAITSRVKCVVCAELLVSVVLLLLELSVGVEWGWGVFCPLVLLYVSTLMYNVLPPASLFEAVQVEPEEYWNLHIHTVHLHIHTVHLQTIKVYVFTNCSNMFRCSHTINRERTIVPSK